MADERCPRCFNQISGFVTGEDALWTDDPIKTPKGEAGDLYKGFVYLAPIHIEEIQQIRQQQETDVGIAEENRTIFTPVRIEGQRVYFHIKHLRELRESTEKILNASEQSKEEYFNYDEEATEYNIGNHQLDWHDTDLTQKFLDIKAVHIEDLRHYIWIGSPCVGSLVLDIDSDSDTVLLGTTTETGLNQTNVGHIWNSQDDFDCLASPEGSYTRSGYYYTKYIFHWDAQSWTHKTYSLNSVNINNYPQFNFTLGSSAPSENNLICNLKSTDEEYHYTRSYKYDVVRHWVINYYTRCYDVYDNLLWERLHPGGEWGYIPGTSYPHTYYIIDISDDIDEYDDGYRWAIVRR